MTYAAIDRAVRDAGMFCRGGFIPAPEDGLSGIAAVVLVGNAGPEFWARAGAGLRATLNPLDDWTRRVLTPIAERFGARALFPFDGPPYLPFLQWARRAEPVHPSPIGPLIHPEFGLWHAYRGAFAFARPLEFPARIDAAPPCETCAAKPCLQTCPVDALGPEGYDVAACVGHLERPAGADCVALGCRARRACPVGTEYLYPPAQARLHMESFVRAQRETPDPP